MDNENNILINEQGCIEARGSKEFMERAMHIISDTEIDAREAGKREVVGNIVKGIEKFLNKENGQ